MSVTLQHELATVKAKCMVCFKQIGKGEPIRLVRKFANGTQRWVHVLLPRRPRRRRRRQHPGSGRGPEPRRYYRLFDLNTPCWQAVRQAAEASRSSAYEWLDRATFDDLLPPPNVRIEYRDPFAEGAARRTLLGLLLWMRRPARCAAVLPDLQQRPRCPQCLPN